MVFVDLVIADTVNITENSYRISILQKIVPKRFQGKRLNPKKESITYHLCLGLS